MRPGESPGARTTTRAGTAAEEGDEGQEREEAPHINIQCVRFGPHQDPFCRKKKGEWGEFESISYWTYGRFIRIRMILKG